MKKSGFTLIELLAVIVILAILLTIAIPNVIGISQKIRRNMFCSKIDDIESAAKLYGNDYEDVLEENGNTLTIHVYTLIENNLFKKEDNNCVLNSNDNEKNNYCVKDPRDNSKLDDATIVITKRDKRIYASYQYKNEDDRNLCTSK